ncbi:hypothetical protein [Bdellovibrio sp. HCB2-146]|uniref:hypothetical protein n=1 Tax=Bdellovibrio sp. HCB2-146 TaxID=3394362 RepID=UPI0039BCEAAE
MFIFKFLCVATILSGSAAFATGFAFGKNADVARIEELLPLSRTEKVQRIQSLGVLVQDHVFESSELRGQFLDQTHFPNIAAPTIWLSSQADEWTLVHEFIHYLLSLETSAEPLISETEKSQAQSRLSTGWKFYQKNQWHYISPQHREQVTTAFAKVVQAQLQQLESFELEELAIENYLRGIFKGTRPIGFTDEAWNRSSRYMKKSGGAALARLKELSVSCSELELSYQREQVPYPQEIVGLCLKVQSLRSEVATLLQGASIRIYEPIGDK